MTVQVKKRDADKVLAAIKRQFAGWIEPGHPETGPQLVKDYDWLGDDWLGDGGAPYAVLWESGPYEWTYLAGEGGIEEEFGFKIKAVEFPEAVFVEPITHFALGIYPA